MDTDLRESDPQHIVTENMNAMLDYLKGFKSDIVSYYKKSYSKSTLDNNFIQYSLKINTRFMRNYILQLNDTITSFEKLVALQASKNSNIIEYIRANKDMIMNNDSMVSYVGYKYSLDKKLNFKLYDNIKSLVTDISKDGNNCKEMFYDASNMMKTNYFDIVRSTCINQPSPIPASKFDSEIRNYFRSMQKSPKSILLTDKDIKNIVDTLLQPSSLCSLLNSDISNLKAECEMVISTMERLNKIKTTNQLSYLSSNNDIEDVENEEYRDKFMKVKYTQLVNTCGIYLYAISIKSQLIIESMKQDFTIMEYMMNHNNERSNKYDY